jgi:Tol biopolymer transport system component
MDPQTGIWDIWILDVASGVRTKVTSGGSNNSDPVWSPDGTAIAFVSDRGGGDGIYRKAVDGTGAEEPLYQADRLGDVIPTDWRAGTIVFSQSRFAPAGWDVFLLRLEDGSVSPLPEPRAPVRYAGRISPDGRWLAYAAAHAGGFEVYVRPLGGEGATVQVSRGGGIHPRWTADGRTIHYWAQPGGIKAVDVDTTSGSVRAGAPRLVIAVRVAELIDGRTHYDVTRDGQRFLLRQPMVAAEPPIGVIVNWMRKLSR